MDEAIARSRLVSKLPSQRSESAHWLGRHPSSDHESLLRDALDREIVPAVKRAMQSALSRLQASAVQGPSTRDATEPPPSTRPTVGADSFALDNYIAGLVRHETEPVIGWLRRSAAREIRGELLASQTGKNIETLRMRLDGVTSLLTARKSAEWRSESLDALLIRCLPPGVEVLLNSEGDGSDEYIDVDEALSSLVFGNALRNALEASSAANPSAVEVTYGVWRSDFRVRITNTFDGDRFDLEDVVRPGTSTKSNHRGLGLAAALAAAARMNWNISLEGRAGVAVFIITGSRQHA